MPLLFFAREHLQKPTHCGQYPFRQSDTKTLAILARAASNVSAEYPSAVWAEVTPSNHNARRLPHPLDVLLAEYLATRIANDAHLDKAHRSFRYGLQKHLASSILQLQSSYSGSPL